MLDAAISHSHESASKRIRSVCRGAFLRKNPTPVSSIREDERFISVAIVTVFKIESKGVSTLFCENLMTMDILVNAGAVAKLEGTNDYRGGRNYLDAI